jgi:glycosyltransferase involved in cell wall biosynthesis
VPRVAIDGRTLQARPPGGIGRTLAALVPEIALRTDLDLLLDSRRPPLLGDQPGLRAHSLRGPASTRDSVWLQLTAPRWLRGYGGAFHCPFYGLPYVQPVPMVVTIHDLTFEFAPELFEPHKRFVFRRQARWAAKTAQRILTPSEHVRSMVLERYARHGVQPHAVVATGLPVDPAFQRVEPGDLASRLERLGIPQPYVVTLGGAARRQLSVAIDAWRKALRAAGAEPRDIPLVVVSGEAPPPAEGVIYAGTLDDRDLAAVFAGARAFCYATRYEGYGMPALEAAACGTPVVCARVGSLPEVLGDAAAWCDGPNAEALGAALARVLSDPGEARRLSDAAVARARSLRPAAEVAGIMVRAYREALDVRE